MEEFFKELELTEEDAKRTKYIYEEYLAKESEEPKLDLEDFTYCMLELGLIPVEIKVRLERLIEIKKHFNIPTYSEESILRQLNLVIDEIKESSKVNIEEE